MGGTMTYTGRLIEAGQREHPSLMDIAIGCSRAPRFAGQTARWWSVLDHLLFCDELMQLRTEGWHPVIPVGARRARLAVLLHDAHEAITGDVPTHVKGADLRNVQAGLDIGIMEAFFPGGLAGYNVWASEVKQIDRTALIAEARVLGPPVGLQRLEEVEPLFRPTLASDDAERVLRELLGADSWAGIPPRMRDQSKHPAVEQYLWRMVQLM